MINLKGTVKTTMPEKRHFLLLSHKGQSDAVIFLKEYKKPMKQPCL
jgi:hypothetical protein